MSAKYLDLSKTTRIIAKDDNLILMTNYQKDDYANDTEVAIANTRSKVMFYIVKMGAVLRRGQWVNLEDTDTVTIDEVKEYDKR
ncbi:hypothetical protein [Clostridium sp.]|uniref:hypothetical protein n=1 Tax=Clostridium sp. TaxID=1506 RepID=UPI001A5437BA|nr:hypothetical protein [Clostridium sp.]MBK5234034.1 hypothetical protein [Clostridium sp.]